MGRSAADQLEYDNAFKSAKFKLEFALDNEDALLSVRGGEGCLKAAEDFWDRMLLIEKGQSTEQFTPAMFSYIDGIYEKTWKGAGEQSVGRHIDKKRKGLRYGHQ